MMLGAGRALVRVDPLTQADAIYVLGGSRADRWLEAVSLFQQGYAPRIVMSPGGREPGAVLLAARGIHIPNDADLGAAVMTDHLGIPKNAVIILDQPVDNTAAEAEAILDLATRERWSRLVVITSRSATRRAGYAFERVLPETITVIMRDTQFDDFNPTWWWRTRPSFRQTFYEFPKLVAYWMGLGA
jgi:uncharacterized SAM-binding protein YcdF (DUF218 family)